MTRCDFDVGTAADSSVHVWVQDGDEAVAGARGEEVFTNDAEDAQGFGRRAGRRTGSRPASAPGTPVYGHPTALVGRRQRPRRGPDRLGWSDELVRPANRRGPEVPRLPSAPWQPGSLSPNRSPSSGLDAHARRRPRRRRADRPHARRAARARSSARRRWSSAAPPRSTTECSRPGRDLVVVGRAGIGLDNVDVEAATRRGVMVVNAPQSNVLSAAEHTMALLLAQARNIPQAHADLKAGRVEPLEVGGRRAARQDARHRRPRPGRRARRPAGRTRSACGSSPTTRT